MARKEETSELQGDSALKPDIRTRALMTPPLWVLITVFNLGITLLFWLIGSLYSQLLAQVQAPAVKYEVAAIKLTKSNDPRRRGMEFLPGGRFRSTNTPLFQVLATAYNIPWQYLAIMMPALG
jgi:hypothetical protein